MKEITVNGWKFGVMTKEEIEKCYSSKEKNFTKIDYYNYLYNDFARDQLYKSVFQSYLSPIQTLSMLKYIH